MNPFFTLIQGGDVYAPEPAGRRSILLAGDSILRIGDRDDEGAGDAAALDALLVPYEVVDARGGLVLPGLIDPHEHVIGAGGEQGFGSRTREVDIQELLLGAITTVVGVLGTDTTARHLTSLLAKVRQLEEQGVTAYLYTGGYPVPTPTITGSIQDDLVIVDKVIGLGEIAISDARSLEPPVPELAKIVSQTMVGGTLGGKAGVTHFHTGPGKKLLACLHTLVSDCEVEPRYLYPTHVNRTPALMDSAIELARIGAFVDVDVTADDLHESLAYYRDHHGPAGQLTASTDSGTPGSRPFKLHQNLARCVLEHGFPLEVVLPLVTKNTATVLKLERKGHLDEGADADVLVLDRETLAVRHVFARGRHLVQEGRWAK
jgi:beta-aspartyl-dipeptidase (metallo-type)